MWIFVRLRCALPDALSTHTWIQQGSCGPVSERRFVFKLQINLCKNLSKSSAKAPKISHTHVVRGLRIERLYFDKWRCATSVETETATPKPPNQKYTATSLECSPHKSALAKSIFKPHFFFFFCPLSHLQLASVWLCLKLCAHSGRRVFRFRSGSLFVALMDCIFGFGAKTRTPQRI